MLLQIQQFFAAESNVLFFEACSGLCELRIESMDQSNLERVPSDSAMLRSTTVASIMQRKGEAQMKIQTIRKQYRLQQAGVSVQ